MSKRLFFRRPCFLLLLVAALFVSSCLGDPETIPAPRVGPVGFPEQPVQDEAVNPAPEEPQPAFAEDLAIEPAPEPEPEPEPEPTQRSGAP